MPRFYENVFIGAGLSCLAAARRCRGDSIVLEAEERPGGLCRSERVGGFTFDYTGHLLHLRRSRVRRWVRQLLGDNLVRHRRSAWIFSHRVYTRYPYQGHFWGLPPRVAAECLLGFIQARQEGRPGQARDFASWAREQFGAGVARHFMLPYNRKLWTVDPAQLTLEWLDRFVPRPRLEQVVRGALEDVDDAAGYNAYFYYPRRGGIASLVEALARGLRLECGQRVTSIDLQKRRLRTSGGELLAFGNLVSCLPLPRLVGLCRPLPDGVRDRAAELRWAGVYNLNLGLTGKAPARHWVYLPERKYRAYRFGYGSNFSDSVAPPGHQAVYVEASYRGGRRPDRRRLRRRLLADLAAAGVRSAAEKPQVVCELDIPFAYVIYDRRRTPAVRAIHRYLQRRRVYPIGRYGRWEYSAMEDALAQGIELAERLRRR